MVVSHRNKNIITHRSGMCRRNITVGVCWLEFGKSSIGPRSVVRLRAATPPAIVAAMSAYQIERVLSVSSPGLKEPVILRKFKEIDGDTFVLVAKSDRAIGRLFMGKSTPNERSLAKTDIIETLIARRNEKTMSAITPAAAEDLGIDDQQPPMKRTKIDKSLFPSFVEIKGPTVASIEGICMKVLPEISTKSPLWVEITSTVVEYIAQVVQHQVQTSDRSTRERKVKEEGADGITYEHRRDAWRARRSDGSQKYFSSKSHVDPASAAAEWAAGASQDDPASQGDDARASSSAGA